MKVEQNKEEIIRFGKFLVVGIINTSVTYITYIILRLSGIIPEISNAIGYVVGVINSFVWNKKWVFQTRNTNVYLEVCSFLIVFCVCYGIQLYVFSFILHNLGWNEYFTQFFGMIVYTVLNFVLNRVFSFKRR